MEQNHSDIMTELAKQFEPLLSQSGEGIYLWLDNEHMICNDHLAKLFGYTSANDVASAGTFLETFVAPSDQENFASNYTKCIAKMGFPITFTFQAVKKDGSQFKAETVMIPLSFSDHLFAYHFVREAN